MEFIPRVAFDAPFCFQILPERDFPKPTVTTVGSTLLIGRRSPIGEAAALTEANRKRAELPLLTVKSIEGVIVAEADGASCAGENQGSTAPQRVLSIDSPGRYVWVDCPRNAHATSAPAAALTGTTAVCHTSTCSAWKLAQ